MKKFPILVLLIVLCAGPTSPAPQARMVSMIQLISNPEKYDGKVVTVIGFMRIGIEADSLYLSHEDDQHGILADALWFERNPKIMEQSEILDMNYVLLTGVFVAKPISYDPAAAGGITGITRAERWSELKHPRRTLGREKEQ